MFITDFLDKFVDRFDLFVSSLLESIISYGANIPRVSHLFESDGFNEQTGSSFLVGTVLPPLGTLGKFEKSGIEVWSLLGMIGGDGIEILLLPLIRLAFTDSFIDCDKAFNLKSVEDKRFAKVRRENLIVKQKEMDLTVIGF